MDYWSIRFPFWLSCLIWGGVMLITAVYGFKLMKWLNYIAVPALILMCLYGMYHAISVTGCITGPNTSLKKSGYSSSISFSSQSV